MHMGIILLLMLSLMVLNTSLNPLKLSLCLTYISILMSLISYNITNSILTTTVVMISFSSGMMILFSYCSIMCNYEEKSFQKKPIYILVLIMTLILPSILTMTSTTNTTPIYKMVSETFSTLSLMFIMFMVILSMVSINISFFNPTKKFMMSY